MFCLAWWNSYTCLLNWCRMLQPIYKHGPSLLTRASLDQSGSSIIQLGVSVGMQMYWNSYACLLNWCRILNLFIGVDHHFWTNQPLGQSGLPAMQLGVFVGIQTHWFVHRLTPNGWVPSDRCCCSIYMWLLRLSKTLRLDHWPWRGHGRRHGRGLGRAEQEHKLS